MKGSGSATSCMHRYMRHRVHVLSTIALLPQSAIAQSKSYMHRDPDHRVRQSGIKYLYISVLPLMSAMGATTVKLSIPLLGWSESNIGATTGAVGGVGGVSGAWVHIAAAASSR